MSEFTVDEIRRRIAALKEGGNGCVCKLSYKYLPHVGGLCDYGCASDLRGYAREICHRRLEKIVAETKWLLPHLKAGSDGFVYFDVFEHTLSEDDSYAVSVHKETGRWNLVRWRFGSLKVLCTFDELPALLEYIQEHHYYREQND